MRHQIGLFVRRAATIFADVKYCEIFRNGVLSNQIFKSLTRLPTGEVWGRSEPTDELRSKLGWNLPMILSESQIVGSFYLSHPYCSPIYIIVIPTHCIVIPAKAGIQKNMTNNYYVYILASDRNGTLYGGVTNDLVRRVWQHKNHKIKGFTDKYDVDKLVYYEATSDIKSAIQRENNIQAWKRSWKIRIIEEFNDYWDDLFY